MQNVSVTGRSPSQDYYMVSPQVHSPHCLTVLNINTLVYRFALAIFSSPFFLLFLSHICCVFLTIFICFSSFITNILNPTIKSANNIFLLLYLLSIIRNTFFFTFFDKLIMSGRRVDHLTFECTPHLKISRDCKDFTGL